MVISDLPFLPSLRNSVAVIAHGCFIFSFCFAFFIPYFIDKRLNIFFIFNAHFFCNTLKCVLRLENRRLRSIIYPNELKL